MWTLHPPPAFLFDGEDWGETSPPQAVLVTLFWPQPIG